MLDPLLVSRRVTPGGVRLPAGERRVAVCCCLRCCTRISASRSDADACTCRATQRVELRRRTRVNELALLSATPFAIGLSACANELFGCGRSTTGGGAVGCTTFADGGGSGFSGEFACACATLGRRIDDACGAAPGTASKFPLAA